VFASTKMGGVCFAFPDVCKVPAPPAPPIPTPFPNFGQCPMALAPTCALKVKILNQPALTVNTKIPRTNGDEAGVGGGMVSQTFGDQAAYAMGSTVVQIEGNPAAAAFKPTRHNGANANAPAGSQIVPSQTKVIVAR
jgi:hypothetical protein